MSTILGLDIGTEFVKAVLARPTKKGDLEILGVGKAKQVEGNMHAGAVADIPAVVNVCEEALVQVEEQAGERADLTVVGIAGELIKGNTTTVNYNRNEINICKKFFFIYLGNSGIQDIFSFFKLQKFLHAFTPLYINDNFNITYILSDKT